MKKLLIIGLIFGSLNCLGQSGPKYKNQKQWEKNVDLKKIVRVEKEDLKTPILKNQKRWNKDSLDVYESTLIRIDYQNIKGPKYKNK